jgi:tRNA A-37 threonylcarbamoyl transferase component Bud32
MTSTAKSMTPVSDLYAAIREVSATAEVAYVCTEEQARMVEPTSALSSVIVFSGEDKPEFPEQLTRAAASIFIVDFSRECVDRAVEILKNESGSMAGAVSVLLMGVEAADYRHLVAKISDLMDAGANDVDVLPKESSQLQCLLTVSLAKAEVHRQQIDHFEDKIASARRQCHNLFWQMSHEVVQGMPEMRENLEEVYGERVGNINILRKVGRGASSEVFLCRNTAKGKDCAVKVFKKSSIRTWEKLSSVVTEYEYLRKLKHPNIAEGINLVQGLRNIYLFVEMVGTMNLFHLIKSSGEEGLSWPRARGVLVDVFDGTAYMHGQGIAHCDLKPENIAMSPSGCAKIIDFGQAVTLEDAPELENPRGTMPFMAPEMMRLSKTWDPAAADVWSLGVIMVEVLCGNHIFARILGWGRDVGSREEFKHCADELSVRFCQESKDGLIQGILQISKSQPPPCLSHTLACFLEVSPASRWSAKQAVDSLKEN